MANHRDDFSEPTKRALAFRASHMCSFDGCDQSTIGPSGEAPDAWSMVGVAAHICAAAPGGRRYDPAMTPEERSAISNGIWLCQTHSVVIDRDEVSFPATGLRDMKRRHEASRSFDPIYLNSEHDYIAVIKPYIITNAEIISLSKFYVYLKSIKLANEAASQLADDVLEGPRASPAGIYLHVSGTKDLIYKKIKHLSPIISSNPRHEIEIVQHVYIENTSAITEVERTIGSISRALRWEATDKGMYLEIPLTERESVVLAAISSVKIFTSAQHVIDKSMELVHKIMGWSTEGEDFYPSLKNIHSQDDFARMLVMVFEDITLCELSFGEVSREDFPSKVLLVVTAFVKGSGIVSEGLGDPRINLITKHYGTILSRIRFTSINPEIIIEPHRTLDGIVIHISYCWAPK